MSGEIIQVVTLLWNFLLPEITSANAKESYFGHSLELSVFSWSEHGEVQLKLYDWIFLCMQTANISRYYPAMIYPTRIISSVYSNFYFIGMFSEPFRLLSCMQYGLSVGLFIWDMLV